MNTIHATKHRLAPKRLACALASCLCLAAPALNAQSTNATLRGHAAAGADVTATNVDTGLTRHTKVTADGSYALAGLPPGTYRVDAGPGTERTVTLTVASTATLDLAGTAAEPAPSGAQQLESVTVTANTLAEVKTSEIGDTISLRQIQTIPQATRNFLEFADTVPGMAFVRDPVSGTYKLQGGAQSANNINVYIDGVGQKNYVLQGGISGQDSSRGNPFPQLGIAEYKVITQNYKAEYDQLSSAGVTAVTKSGTNEFHGEVFGNYTGSPWRSPYPSELASGHKLDTTDQEYGLALGGPIMKDLAHFFFTYEGKDYETPVAVVPGEDPLPGPLPPGVDANFGPALVPFHEDLYFGKIDWEPTDRDLVELSGKYRKEKQRDNVGNQQAASFASSIVNDDKRADLRWQHTADSWLNDLHLTWEDTTWGPRPLNDGIAQFYTDPENQDRMLLQTGAGANYQNKGQKGPSIQDDFSFTDLHWAGDHLVKMGFKYKEVKLSTQEINPANPQFFYDVTSDGTATDPYKVHFGVPLAGVGDGTAESTNKQLGLYVQDDWAVNDKLTLNLGVRWDYEKTPGYLDYVTPADVVDALRNWPNINNPNSGININDYISNGHNRSAPKDEWQPRLGFSYDLNADEQHVIIGGLGRSYDRDSFDYLQLERSKATFPSYDVFFNSPNGRACDPGTQTNCVNWDPRFYDPATLLSLVNANGGGREIDLINNNLKVPYSDQASLGMRNRIGDWNTSVVVSRIVSKDGFQFLLGNRRPDGSFWGSTPDDHGQPWSFGIPGYGSLIIGTNGVETKSNSLLLSLEKPYTRESGWYFNVAYTYTDAKENRKSAGTYGNNYGFDEEFISDYPFLPSYGVPKHRLVISASVDGPWGMTYSGKLTLASRSVISDVGCWDPTTHCSPADTYAPGASFLVGGPMFGEREIDLAVNKDIDLSGGYTLYVRGDLLNAFNLKNYSDYNVNWGSNGVYNPVVTTTKSGNMWTLPRTFKLTLGLRF
ncbi:MAG TPA: TonB-dependent receptor [Dokdonella sp.]